MPERSLFLGTTVVLLNDIWVQKGLTNCQIVLLRLLGYITAYRQVCVVRVCQELSAILLRLYRILIR